jgi:hypothetical protein
MGSSNLRKVDPDCCKNCGFLQWGPEEGWDKCSKTGRGVDWSQKSKQVCDYHRRCEGDPRNQKPPTSNCCPCLPYSFIDEAMSI